MRRCSLAGKCCRLLLLFWLGGTVSMGAAPRVDSFTLIDADRNEPIPGFDPMPKRAILDLDALPAKHLNLRANTDPDTLGSVRFYLSTISYRHLENRAPYALFSDADGDYAPWTPKPGSYLVTAIPYTEADGQGEAGVRARQRFTVAVAPPLPPMPATPSAAKLPGAGERTPQPGVYGELKRWHKVTIALQGPLVAERGTPNPFLDYRLDVTFTHVASKRSLRVPGYFAADGEAAETGADAGRIWRVHFCPDAVGTWQYVASFRVGDGVAVSDDPTAGEPGPGDGEKGHFDVTESDKKAPDLRARGRLCYVGKRYLRFAGSGEWFLKAGADAPENLLGYADFDGTSSQFWRSLKTWAPHIRDWQPGDPTWQGGKGKGLIGAINYLAAAGQNAISFLTYNAGGDSRDVWPFVTATARLQYDCSKLDQWEIVFCHAERRGFYLHFKTQETENDNGTWGLDRGEVGPQRKLYYRELVARFGHHLALNWNLGEENSQTTAQQQAMAAAFAALDPYQNHRVIHTFPSKQDEVYRPLLGEASALTGISLQTEWSRVHGDTLRWIEASAAAGKPWVAAADETGPASVGVPPDTGYDGYTGSREPSQDEVRRYVLWGNLMAGGGGVEYYFGYQVPQSDLTCQDWRSRARMWAMNRHALAFFREHLPFWEMENADGKVGNAEHRNGPFCLAKAGEVYAVYLPRGGSVTLDLGDHTGEFDVRWFDPRAGGPLQEGAVKQVKGSGKVELGAGPSAPGEDWALLVRRAATP